MYEEEIRNGLELLDAKLGRDTWIARVNPKTIHMSSCANCIAAQATGESYAKALNILGIVSDEDLTDLRENFFSFPDGVAELETHYGFEVIRGLNAPVERILTNLTHLEREWRDTIIALKISAQRRSSQPLSPPQ